MKRVAIIGAGDMGRHLNRVFSESLETVGFFDDFASSSSVVDGLPVLGGLSAVESAYAQAKFDFLVLAIGYKHLEQRLGIFSRFQGKIPFLTWVHPSSYVDASCRLGEGVVVLAGCVLDVNVHVGDVAFLNVSCTVAHDSVIGRNSFLAPRTTVAGFCSIGESNFLGIGTVVRDNITTCANTQTGAGAVVCKNTESSGLYLGLPAKLRD